MSTTIDLDDFARDGAWFVTGADLDGLARAATASGLRVARVSLRQCADKAEALRRIADALAFPATFGGNWDALSDCLRDLAWLPAARGTVLLFADAAGLRDAAEPAFDTLLEVLDDAATAWKARATPFFAFLALPDDAFPAPRA